MQQAVGARGQVHEGTEGGGLHNLAVVGFAGFRNVRVGDLVDDLLGLFSAVATFGGDEHGTVIFDGDLRTGLFLNLVDHLALRTDDFADLVDRNGGGDDARCVRAHLGRTIDALVDDFENGGTGFLGLLQSRGQNVSRNAVELGIELQSGDELGSTGNLEVHIAEGVFGAENIGQGLEDVLAVNIAGHEAHGDARNRGLQRHACGEQRQCGRAHGTHGGGTVGTNGFGDLTDGVRELFAVRQHRHESLLRQRTVADLTALRGTDATGLAGGIRRHLIVMHVTLGLRTGQCVDLLFHLEHVQGGDAQNLGFATLEQCGTVHARNDVHFSGQGADVTQATAIDAVILGQDAATHDLALQLLERIADLLFLLGIVHVGEFTGERGLDALLDLMDAILARQLLGNGEGFVEIGVGDLIDTVVQIFGVLREELEFLGFLRSDVLKFGLSLADHLDERLGCFKTTGNDFLVRLGLAFVVDEVPGVLACASFDHSDGDIAVLHHAAGNHDFEHGALTLAPTRESNPLAVDQSQANAGNRAFERQTGNQSGSGSSVQCDHIVSIVRVDGEHGFHNLHFVAQRVREQRAQWAVNNAASENSFGARAAFTAEERSRNLAGGVHLLFHVHGQREEVVVLLRAGTGGGGRQNHRIIVKIGGDGTIRLLGETTGLEAQRALTKRTIINYGFNSLDFGTLHRVPPFFFFFYQLSAVLFSGLQPISACVTRRYLRRFLIFRF